MTQNVTCIVRGSVNNDECFHVSHIVRPGETLSSTAQESRIGGKGANQAVAIARAGGSVKFYAAIGKDGLWIKERLAAEGVDASEILVSEVPTGRAIIQVDSEGENSIILFPGANHSQIHEENFALQGDRWFPDATHLLLQNEIQMRSTLYALRNVTPRATVILNPSPLPSTDQVREFPWDRVDWLVVNAMEAMELYNAVSTAEGQVEVADEPRELIRKLSKARPFAKTNLVCTLGSKGVLACLSRFHNHSEAVDSGEPSLIYVPAAKLLGDVQDTTGAGDCFTGYFVKGLMDLGPDAKVGSGIAEEDVARILRTCAVAAGMCVQKRGTIDSIPKNAQVEERIALSA